MQISNLRVRDIENRWESLSLCLQAVARWAGVELHFRSINAALGLSFMVSAPGTFMAAMAGGTDAKSPEATAPRMAEQNSLGFARQDRAAAGDVSVFVHLPDNPFALPAVAENLAHSDQV